MGSSPSGSRNSFHVLSTFIIHFFLGGSEVVEEGGAGCQSVEKAFGVIDGSADGMVDAGGDNKGEDARVKAAPTSRESIMICTWMKMKGIPAGKGGELLLTKMMPNPALRHEIHKL